MTTDSGPQLISNKMSSYLGDRAARKSRRRPRVYDRSHLIHKHRPPQWPDAAGARPVTNDASAASRGTRGPTTAGSRNVASATATQVPASTCSRTSPRAYATRGTLRPRFRA
ncbi:hypothetical protein DPEC_G00339950 [Dallia pectoralis]|uniref:Uncharacterized protein n=1 Tax=Dallia pectoralis TaxID=75939 RepID=A0ACC2F511_DALPE|nr:hypothetical protein DPEC_G00339950 [Dallia pectoralis]